MHLNQICLRNFRNYKELNVSFAPGVNLLIGDNAQGKTNALEGIYIFSRGKSFRAGEERELVRFGCDGFRIAIEYEDKDGTSTLEYATHGRDRLRKKNGYRLKGVSEMIGSFDSIPISDHVPELR